MRKRKFKILLLIILFCWLSYGIIISLFDVKIIERNLSTENSEYFYDYSGITHIHSKDSSGSGSLKDIIMAAKEQNIDFLYITDLDKFSQKEKKAYIDNILILNGGEFSYLDSRLLNYDFITRQHHKSPGNAQIHFSNLLSQKDPDIEFGSIFMSSPLKRGNKWNGPYPEGLSGIEVLNLKSLWEGSWLNSKADFIWTLIIYPFNPRLSFLRLFLPEIKEFKLWDKLNKKHKYIGMAGSDAEARVNFLNLTSVDIPGYSTIFSIVKNHVLLESELIGQFENDSREISRAIKQGQFYMSLDLLADPKGFASFIESRAGKIYPLGAKLNYKKGLKLNVILPQKPRYPFEVNIYKDGEVIVSSTQKNTSLELREKGVYRVLVRVIPTLPLPDGKRWFPWIITNPFFIE